MKYVCITAVLLFIECGYDFPSSYQCVEENKIRPIAVIIDNQGLAEAAPQDLITMRVYLGGESVQNLQLHFSNANQISDSNSTEDTSLIVPGSMKLFSNENNDSVVFNLKIPDSVIITAFKNANSLRALLPPDTHDSIPTALLDRKPLEIIELLEKMAYAPNADQNSALNMLAAISGNDKSSVEKNLPLLLQVFTVPIKVHALINNRYKIESTVSIRYNSRLQYLGTIVPINRNPHINQFILYKVKGDLKSFDPYFDLNLIDTSYDFSNTQKISFTKGFSYFLAAYRDPFFIDYGVTINRTKGQEDFMFEWFYQNSYSSKTPADSLFKVENWPPNSYMIRLLPPLSSEQKYFNIWLVIYDYYIGERLRPVGFVIKQADVEIVE